MFEIGFAELFLLGVIALLVVGPDRLPALARTVGVWVGRAQRLVGQVRADIEREVRADELRKAAKEYSPTGMIGDMRKEVEDFAGEVFEAGGPRRGEGRVRKAGHERHRAGHSGGGRERHGHRTGAGTGRAGSGVGRAVGDGSGRNRNRSSHLLWRRTRRRPERRHRNGEPEHTVDSRPAAEPEAEDAGLTNGRVAAETAAAAVTEGPETTPAERDERSAAP